MRKKLAWTMAISLILVFLALPWLLALQGLSWNLPGLTAELWRYPGIGTAITTSLLCGVSATLLSTCLASLFISKSEGSRQLKGSGLSLTFAAPHLAFAIAFLWLLTPYGWIDRLIPWLTLGFEQQSLTTLITILVIKETPFLVVLGRQQLAQLPHQQWLLQAQILGASRTRGWWLVVFPAWLRQMRLLIIAVAIYSVAVVDIALVAGPLNPPLLGPLLMSWQQQFGVAEQNLAAQGLWLVLAAGVFMVAWVKLQEWSVKRLCRGLLRRAGGNHRWLPEGAISVSLQLLKWVLLAVTLLSGLALLAMSLGQGWFYPRLTPLEWQFAEAWQLALGSLPVVVMTLALALATAVMVTVILVTLREWQRLRGHEFADIWFIAALLIPQLGLVIAWLQAESLPVVSMHAEHAWLLTWYAHCWFAFAYSYLSYAPAERACSQMHLNLGRSLGYGYWKSWWYFKRPALRDALKHCLLVSFLVSLAQYVPTVLLGSGYIQTLTTELVALSSGAELRLPAIIASVLWVLAALAILMTARGAPASAPIRKLTGREE
ncbi:hypothetical protein [Pseudidiomarina insulisalsae]|uniref:ABC transmembrane type-1 domain-containing protein n=1 Tax=Pseudidiomarina insulisalsae TaxID=575789 RepID=A0A432YH18_9GAMM|nr:hypothetical protein [Pseudidiomarina insulisalsae]RUO60220.1 hypothetical protein CWI71_07360 [Pseudidiomarina insulisalsae]